ncbi:unnamed protein product [Diabrotica balteata]|uniref:Endonuclease-reverse transcriptase n=1 Tax=Diabrotica balteata TaxID=107213 RepID=A0A9N9T1C1_DIABA|nr:unnamed protein product [Diabrotica balteata]
MEINLKKTEYLITENTKIKQLEIEEGKQIKGTNKYQYLGFIILNKRTTEEDIKNRPGQTRDCIRKLNPVLWDKNISMKTKKKIYNTMTRSILTYGCENWTINKKTKNKIRATEMEFLRRSCRLTRRDRINNMGIKRRMGINSDIIDYIEQKRITWYGHVRRADQNRWIK